MAETKKTTTKKPAAKKSTTAKKTTSSATKRTTTKKPVATKTAVRKAPAKKTSNLSNAEQSFKLSNDTAMFGVWIDALILVFVVIMFALILYGYVMAA